MGRYFKQHKLLVAIAAIGAFITATLVSGVAVLLQQALDLALGGDMDQFMRSLTVTVVYFLIMGGCVYLYALSLQRMSLRIVKTIRHAAFSGMMRRNMEEFHEVNTADYLSALNNDITTLQTNYIDNVFGIVYHAALFVSSLVVMLYFDVLVTLAVIGTALLMFIVPAVLGKALQKRQKIQSETLSAFMVRLKDFFSGFEIIRTYRMDAFTQKAFAKENDELFTAQYRVGKLMAMVAGLTATLGILVQVVAIFLSAYFIITGRISIGMLLGIVQASGRLVAPVGTLFGTIPMIQGAKPIVERINGFAEHESSGFVGTKAPTFEQGITVSDVKFGYTEEDTTLQNISAHFERGKKYAIIGSSGCGKSTLVKLLTGYYSKYEGEIAYDGADLHQLDMDKVGELSATIHQNIYLFDESILDNICLHREFSEADLTQALSVSGVDLFLGEGAKNLSDLVGENGSNLSGGQRQRIAVARALILKKPLLILDEGTASLDLQTAYDIESRLLKESDLTLITITHALHPDLLEGYDGILFMENGTITEAGSYQELMAKEGAFAAYSKITKEA